MDETEIDEAATAYVREYLGGHVEYMDVAEFLAESYDADEDEENIADVQGRAHALLAELMRNVV